MHWMSTDFLRVKQTKERVNSPRQRNHHQGRLRILVKVAVGNLVECPQDECNLWLITAYRSRVSSSHSSETVSQRWEQVTEKARLNHDQPSLKMHSKSFTLRGCHGVKPMANRWEWGKLREPRGSGNSNHENPVSSSQQTLSHLEPPFCTHPEEGKAAGSKTAKRLPPISNNNRCQEKGFST